ncbi:hypothetical protein QYE76_013584 [Lolium multiflorum]|uniref:Uncharacterized protein n=1 Tax=Lolium multiflorum TaxID=4521 RepID=A0AAD8X7D2_LOLMU|nr:hypothetical protein QYE76_013584 [Lolium multiflorum]
MRQDAVPGMLPYHHPKARPDDSMMYPMRTPQDMAQYLMSIAAGIGHNMAAMARAESGRLPGGSARRRCMQRCAADGRS